MTHIDSQQSALFLRRARDGAGTRPARAPDGRTRPGRTEGGEQLVCRYCGRTITTAGQRMEVSGSHEHTFANPEGIVFHIGCFARVQGCVFAGAPTAEWSWFKGYLWSVAYCAGCGAHVGWRYSSGDDVFFGLVLRSLSSVV